ncbi:MAG: hypothetical protein MUF78_08895 [Candidatus Edwardsbacteria bacterium]|nr:hypothetical protein [Candidatus Edwardsbacteria bacterium]
MNQPIDPTANYEATRQAVGYVPRAQAGQATYDGLGFMSGLEVHQQLLTGQKLFCRCPAGIYQEPDDYDAELVRHMRPTLSELGEYDGTALMEFKTRKQIVYRIKSRTACTYEVDDTPPFPLNRQALDIAIEIALLSRLKLVGEVHITRKQYLDGSIPTGFQRTAIIGVEGAIPLRGRTARLIQLSLEEDSCREVSDVGHVRTYRTDRLGMPLIETVTYPDMRNPDEVREACDYIRFLNRSTGKVRTGIGAGREDVNVSCRGGTRVEIKGVSHTAWIPELTHNECFRQWALLEIRKRLLARVPDPAAWKPSSARVRVLTWGLASPALRALRERGQIMVAVNLPGFAGLLSHFTQPGQCFADEIAGRLKVIACLERPNMDHSPRSSPRATGRGSGRSSSPPTATPSWCSGDRRRTSRPRWRRWRNAAGWPSPACPTRRDDRWPTAPRCSSGCCPAPTGCTPTPTASAGVGRARRRRHLPAEEEPGAAGRGHRRRDRLRAQDGGAVLRPRRQARRGPQEAASGFRPPAAARAARVRQGAGAGPGHHQKDAAGGDGIPQDGFRLGPRDHQFREGAHR